MSYIQVEIGGKLRGFMFNNYTWIVFCQSVDYEFYAASKDYALVFAALKSFCYAKKEPVDFSFEDVIGWIEKMPESELKKVNDEYEAMEQYKKLIEQSSKTESSKKKLKKTE